MGATGQSSWNLGLPFPIWQPGQESNFQGSMAEEREERQVPSEEWELFWWVGTVLLLNVQRQGLRPCSPWQAHIL